MPRITVTESRSSTTNTEGFSASVKEGGTTKERNGTQKTVAVRAQSSQVQKEDLGVTVQFTVKINGAC